MPSAESWIGLRQAPGSSAPDAGWSWRDATSPYALPPSMIWDGGSGGQPDDNNPPENMEHDCGSLRADDLFEDDACTDTHDFVCERSWSY